MGGETTNSIESLDVLPKGRISMSPQTRAPKLLGDFGEVLATYALIRKGFEVAVVGHVGADLIET